MEHFFERYRTETYTLLLNLSSSRQPMHVDQCSGKWPWRIAAVVHCSTLYVHSTAATCQMAHIRRHPFSIASWAATATSFSSFYVEASCFIWSQQILPSARNIDTIASKIVCPIVKQHLRIWLSIVPHLWLFGCCLSVIIICCSRLLDLPEPSIRA